MAKKSARTDFFPGNRLELRLNKYELLSVVIDEEEKKRSKLSVEIPLSGKDFKSMPVWVADPFSVMAKANSASGRDVIEVMCKGMTMEVFSTEKVRKRTLMSCTGVVATAFALVATGDGDRRDIALNAVIYVPGNIDLHGWAWDHIHATFFASFEYSQTELDFEPQDDEDDDDQGTLEASDEGDGDEAEDTDPDAAPAIAARAKKPFDPKAIRAGLQ